VRASHVIDLCAPRHPKLCPQASACGMIPASCDAHECCMICLAQICTVLPIAVLWCSSLSQVLACVGAVLCTCRAGSTCLCQPPAFCPNFSRSHATQRCLHCISDCVLCSLGDQAWDNSIAAYVLDVLDQSLCISAFELLTWSNLYVGSFTNHCTPLAMEPLVPWQDVCCARGEVLQGPPGRWHTLCRNRLCPCVWHMAEGLEYELTI
jgi:hypothetical protein